MGFNGVRKHQKIEDPRYLYWADRLGLLVWEEMPSAYRFTKRSVERADPRVDRVIERDISHPCIVAWVPFNESWGVPDLPDSAGAAPLRPGALPPDQDARPDAAGDRQRRLGERRHRHHRHPRLRRPTRPDRRALRAPTRSCRGSSSASGPGGRLLLLEGHAHADQPIMLTEFGGIAYSRGQRAAPGATRAAERAEDLAERYRDLLDGGARPAAVRRLLLHPVHRHLPGGQRPALRGSTPSSRSRRWPPPPPRPRTPTRSRSSEAGASG